jgi:hypothetical protein
MEKQKRQTLNADKRKVIADIFQQHFEDNSKYKKAWQDAKDKYTVMRNQAKTIMEKLVRKHQPQEDVDTIRSMINKYGERNGGELYHDNCFYVQTDTPTYYNAESDIDKYLGFGSRNDVSGNHSFYKDEWKEDFKLWVIGSSYCHQRKFVADNETFNWFKSFDVAKENVILAHKNLFDHVNKKMEKLKLGLKSYRYFDQAKELADKLGVVLNESVLNESSSMALSIYSPTNLADLLTDEVEQTKEDKIAIAKKLLAEQVNSLN